MSPKFDWHGLMPVRKDASVIEVDLVSNREGYSFSLAALRETNEVTFIVAPADFHNVIDTIRQIEPYLKESALISVAIGQDGPVGIFAETAARLEALGYCALTVEYGKGQSRLTLARHNKAIGLNAADAFAYAGHDVTLRFRNPADILRRFPVHLKTFYEIELLEYTLSVGRDGGIVDAGANIGNHSVFWGLMADRPVFAFEPVRDLFDHLCMNVRENGLGDRVRCIDVGLGAQFGRSLVASTMTNNTAATRLRVAAEGDMEIRPLDSFLDEFQCRISILKIDVEGMEVDVIHGASTILSEHRPVVFAEAVDESAESAVRAAMSPFGYAFVRSHCRTPMLEFRHPNAA